MRQLARQAGYSNPYGIAPHHSQRVSPREAGAASYYNHYDEYGPAPLAQLAYAPSPLRPGAAQPIPPQRALVPVASPAARMPQSTAFGPLFRDLRRALKLSLPDLAGRLGTRLDVISALEAGDVRRLPPWPETVRVVSAYTGLAGIDPRAVLTLIRREIAVSDALPMERDEEQPKKREGRSRARPLGAHWPFMAKARALVATAGERMPLDGRRLSAVGAVLIILVAAFAQASTLQASLATLQPPIMGLMRGAQDYFLTRAAPVRDGLRWIEVDDPRERRTDRLPAPRPRPL